MKISPYKVGLLASAHKVASYVAHELFTVMRTLAAHRVGLDVLVHHLVGIEVWAVARKKEQANPRRVFFQPFAHFFAAMYWMAVHDDEDFTVGLFDQASKKTHEHRCGKAIFKHHEVELTAIRDCREYIASKALASTGNRRRFSLGCIRTASLMVRAHTHLIAPIYEGLLDFGRLTNSGVFFRQPALHSGVVTFVRSPYRFLRRESPPRKITPNRPRRNAQLEPAVNQLSHRLRRPQDKRQFELFRVSVTDKVTNSGSLPSFKPAPFPFRPALSGLERVRASGAIRLDPSVDRMTRNAEDFGDLDMSHAVSHSGNRPLSNQFLCGWSKFSSIGFHSSKDTTIYHKMQYKL